MNNEELDMTLADATLAALNAYSDMTVHQLTQKMPGMDDKQVGNALQRLKRAGLATATLDDQGRWRWSAAGESATPAPAGPAEPVAVVSQALTTDAPPAPAPAPEPPPPNPTPAPTAALDDALRHPITLGLPNLDHLPEYRAVVQALRECGMVHPAISASLGHLYDLLTALEDAA